MADSIEKLEDLTEEEKEYNFFWNLKMEYFKKWIDSTECDPEAKALKETMAKVSGAPEQSPAVMMGVAFFAGMDAGIDIAEKIINGGEKRAE